MKRSVLKRTLSLLLAMIMMAGIFATGIPAFANGSAYVYSANQLRDNLQNPNITDVYVYTMDDFVAPWMSVKDGKHDAFIHVVGEKNLHLVGDATIRLQENPNEDYIEFSSLIHVPANASLTIDGDGCLNFHARWKNLINAVINNEGNLTIHNADLGGFYSNQETAACAIWHHGGYMTINDGKFYGLNNDPDIENWSAVRVQAPATIRGGYFRCAAGDKTSYGLMIPNPISGDVTITGGTFRHIYLPTDDSVMATYVPGQYTTLRDGNWFNKDAAYSREYLAGGTIRVVHWIKNVAVSIKAPVDGQPLDYKPVLDAEGCYLTIPKWYRNDNVLDEDAGPSAVAGSSYRLKLYVMAKNTDSYEFATPGNITATINGTEVSIKEDDFFSREDCIVLEMDFGVCDKSIGQVYLSIAGPEELERVRFAASVTNTDLCSLQSNIRWFENGTEIFSGATFKEGKNYRVAFQIKAKSGSQFPVDAQGNPNVYCRVNGYDAAVFSIPGKDPTQYIQVEFDFGQCNDSIIETIAITGIVPPVPGEHPSYTAAVAGSGYRVDTDQNHYYDAYWVNEKWYYVKNGVSWWDVTTGEYEYVYEHDVFLPGHIYQCEVYVTTESGYEFVMDLYTDPETWPSVTVNGNPGKLTFDAFSNLMWDQEVAYVFPVATANIESVKVSGLEIPVAGNEPDYTATVDNPYLYEMDTESGYESSGIWWYDEEGRYIVPRHHTYEAGQTYHVQLRVAAAKLSNGDLVGQFADQVMVELEGFVVDRVRIWEHVIIIDAYYTCPMTAGSNTITGNITASDDVETVSIQLIAEGVAEPAYEAFGRESFSFTGIPSGHYTMVVSKKNHVPRSYEIEVAEGKINVDVKLHLIGDVTGDGRVNVGDVSKLYAHIRSTAPITDEYQLLCGNVNGGSVNVGDVSAIYAHIKGTKKLY